MGQCLYRKVCAKITKKKSLIYLNKGSQTNVQTILIDYQQLRTYFIQQNTTLVISLDNK